MLSDRRISRIQNAFLRITNTFILFKKIDKDSNLIVKFGLENQNQRNFAADSTIELRMVRDNFLE